MTIPQLRKSGENYISMFFVVICAEKIRRLLRLFLSLFLPGYVPCNGDIYSGWGSGTFSSLKHTNHCPLGNRRFELPAPCYLAVIKSSMRIASQQPLIITTRAASTQTTISSRFDLTYGLQASGASRAKISEENRN